MHVGGVGGGGMRTDCAEARKNVHRKEVASINQFTRLLFGSPQTWARRCLLVQTLRQHVAYISFLLQLDAAIFRCWFVHRRWFANYRHPFAQKRRLTQTFGHERIESKRLSMHIWGPQTMVKKYVACCCQEVSHCSFSRVILYCWRKIDVHLEGTVDEHNNREWIFVPWS